jgi:hypothetical protein
MKYTKEILQHLVESSKSWKELSQKLGNKHGNSQYHVKSKILDFEIDFSHFVDSKKMVKRGEKKDMFTVDSCFNRSTIKYNILKENLIEYKCHNCECDDQWMGKTMPLILDHINGVNNDNRLENLRFLCSNCDSIQTTYKNRNYNKDKREKTLIKQLKKKEEQLKSKFSSIENKKQLILDSNIDFSVKGWGVALAKILNQSPQYSMKWVKKYMFEFYTINCFKHKK